jgi:hypothetical protein
MPERRHPNLVADAQIEGGGLPRRRMRGNNWVRLIMRESAGVGEAID